MSSFVKDGKSATGAESSGTNKSKGSPRKRDTQKGKATGKPAGKPAGKPGGKRNNTKGGGAASGKGKTRQQQPNKPDGDAGGDSGGAKAKNSNGKQTQGSKAANKPQNRPPSHKNKQSNKTNNKSKNKSSDGNIKKSTMSDSKSEVPVKQPKSKPQKPAAEDAHPLSSAKKTTGSSFADRKRANMGNPLSKNSLPVVLMVAEKPSICNSIAYALAPKDKISTHGHSPPVHVLNGTFQGQNCIFKVTSVVGHVYSSDFPQNYQNWQTTSPLELFDAPVKQQVNQKGIVNLLTRESKNCDYLVLWLDCDREGENICFEVISIVEKNLNTLKGNPCQIYRAKFSAVTAHDINKALNNLAYPDENESLAVDARQELDLKVGVAFSRFQTQYFHGRYSDLDSSVVSYGPCQTPTLGFCVKRYLEKLEFKPRLYYVLNLVYMKDGRSCTFQWIHTQRVFKLESIHSQLRNVVSAGELRIDSIEEKMKKKGRPTPLNTVQLLKLASTTLNIGPFQCMQVAERLYLQGLLSYPRTESTAYPSSFDVKFHLNQHKGHDQWGGYVRGLLADGFTKPKGGKDMGDHPPIVPCRCAYSNELHGIEFALYSLVTRHFLATVSADAVFSEVKISASCVDMNGKTQNFAATCKTLVTPGFLTVINEDYSIMEAEDLDGEDDEDETDNKFIPNMQVGDTVQIIQQPEEKNVVFSDVAVVGIKELRTKEPAFLSESELIGRMEKNGIGTDASIPTHINNICKRNYVQLEKGRRLKPTKLGIVLVQGYLRIDRDLVLPIVRAQIEDECNLIAKGVLSKQAVVEKALMHFKTKFIFFMNNITRMDELFGASFSSLENSGKPFTRCGITNRYLSYLPGPPARLYNKLTETVYTLPKPGIFKQWNENKCPVKGCNFEAMLYCIGSPARSYPFCPNCFENLREEWYDRSMPEVVPNSDDEDEQAAHIAANFTLHSPLPDLHPMIQAYKVGDDVDSGGVFILDPSSGKKNKFVSTKSAHILQLPTAVVKKIKVLDKVHEATGSRYVEIEFHPAKSPLEDKGAKYVGCLQEDKLIQNLVKSHEGRGMLARSKVRQAAGRGGSSRGRGGRGGFV